jgi:hypothetical protein
VLLQLPLVPPGALRLAFACQFVLGAGGESPSFGRFFSGFRMKIFGASTLYFQVDLAHKLEALPVGLGLESDHE